MTKSDNDILRGIQIASRAVVADECRNSFYYFFKLFWDVINAEPLKENWHLWFLCEELQKLSYYIINRLPKPYDLIINVPPGTSKSSIATIMFHPWLWTIDPTIRVITNSYSSDLSIEHAVKSKDIITSDKYRQLFDNVELRHDKQGKQHYENTLTGFRFATSTGSAVTGFHGHVILNDDPQNPKQADSEVLRKQSIDHLKTLSSRKIEKANTPTITIMQRLHELDVTGHILTNKEGRVKHICLPAEASDSVKPKEVLKYYKNGFLDPVRLGRGVLDEQKADLGSRGYAGQYDQSPIAEGGNIVKENWFGRISKADFDYLYSRKKPAIHFFADTAYTEKNENDPTGIIAAVEIDNNLYILNGVKVRKEFPELVKFMPQWVKANKYDHRSTVRIEPKANGLSVIQQLKKFTNLNITETDSPDDSKATRLKSNSSIIECGRVILVDGSWIDEFIGEVCGFPAKPHDEYVDILNYAIDYFINNKPVVVDEEQILKDFR